MCGIFGAVGPSLDAAAIDVDSILAALAHRGPDGRGVWTGPGVLLGHLRLAIIDLSERGRQPMRDEQRDVTLTYNGEVYNYLDLRRELEAAGTVFASDSDTEVILAGYGAWGVGVFARLNGMFALALHDAREDALFLVRDHAGIKPLYYAIDGEGNLHFASEIKGIPNHLRGDPDESRMGEYLYFGANHAEEMLLASIRRILPGTYAVYRRSTGELTHHRYWQLPEPAAASVAAHTGKGGHAAQLRALLHAAVGRQLVSDRPVGVFLSGGVDSSAIACIAANEHDRKLDMFTARFRSAPDDTDVRLAAQLSKQLGCPHHIIDIDDRVSLALVDELLDHFDAPFADAAAIPLTLLSRTLPGDMKVILQGDGGDEIFGGYARYRYLAYRSRIAAHGGPLAWMLRWFGSHMPDVLSRRWRRIALALGEQVDAMALARLLTVEFPEDIFAPERIAGNERAMRWRDPFASHKAMMEAAAGATICDKALSVDFHAILPDYFLEKVDRATMAASIEVRVPMLDREIVEFAARLPAAYRMPGGRPKGLLRDALTGTVPDFVLEAPKRGFGVPYGEWIRGPLADAVQAELAQGGPFDRRLVTRMLGEHLSGKSDHSFMLWKLFLLSRWMRRPAVRGLAEVAQGFD